MTFNRWSCRPRGIGQRQTETGRIVKYLREKMIQLYLVEVGRAENLRATSEPSRTNHEPSRAELFWILKIEPRAEPSQNLSEPGQAYELFSTISKTISIKYLLVLTQKQRVDWLQNPLYAIGNRNDHILKLAREWLVSGSRATIENRAEPSFLDFQKSSHEPSRAFSKNGEPSQLASFFQARPTSSNYMENSVFFGKVAYPRFSLYPTSLTILLYGSNRHEISVLKLRIFYCSSSNLH